MIEKNQERGFAWADSLGDRFKNQQSPAGHDRYQFDYLMGDTPPGVEAEITVKEVEEYPDDYSYVQLASIAFKRNAQGRLFPEYDGTVPDEVKAGIEALCAEENKDLPAPSAADELQTEARSAVGRLLPDVVGVSSAEQQRRCEQAREWSYALDDALRGELSADGNAQYQFDSIDDDYAPDEEAQIAFKTIHEVMIGDSVDYSYDFTAVISIKKTPDGRLTPEYDADVPQVVKDAVRKLCDGQRGS